MSKHTDNKSSDEKINELYTLFTDDDFGFAKILKRHDKTIYGNGLPGLVFQVAILYICVTLLAVDSPTVKAVLFGLLGR